MSLSMRSRVRWLFLRQPANGASTMGRKNGVLKYGLRGTAVITKELRSQPGITRTYLGDDWTNNLGGTGVPRSRRVSHYDGLTKRWAGQALHSLRAVFALRDRIKNQFNTARNPEFFVNAE